MHGAHNRCRNAYILSKILDARDANIVGRRKYIIFYYEYLIELATYKFNIATK
jgi:hypothetical protein